MKLNNNELDNYLIYVYINMLLKYVNISLKNNSI